MTSPKCIPVDGMGAIPATSITFNDDDWLRPAQTYGPHTWQVCDLCNFNQHRCHFCGDDLSHAEALHPIGPTHPHPCYQEAT